MPKLCHERVDNDQDSYVKTDIATCLNVISGLNIEEGVQDEEVNSTCQDRANILYFTYMPGQGQHSIFCLHSSTGPIFYILPIQCRPWPV
jgi:hypothetical protein